MRAKVEIAAVHRCRGSGNSGSPRAALLARWGSGESGNLPGRDATAATLAASNPRRVGRGGAGGRESPPCSMGAGERRRLPGRSPAAMRLARIQPAKGWSGCRGTKALTGDATARRCMARTPARCREAPHSQGYPTGGRRLSPPLARWCCSTTHILQPSQPSPRRAPAVYYSRTG
jgi:hypothetical protein